MNVSDWFNSANVAGVAQHIGVTLMKANATKIEITFKCGEQVVINLSIDVDCVSYVFFAIICFIVLPLVSMLQM